MNPESAPAGLPAHVLIRPHGREVAALAVVLTRPEHAGRLIAAVGANPYRLTEVHHRAAYGLLIAAHATGARVDLRSVPYARLAAQMSGQATGWYRKMVEDEIPRWQTYLATLPAWAPDLILDAACAMILDAAFSYRNYYFYNAPVYGVHRPFTGSLIDPQEAPYAVLAYARRDQFTGRLLSASIEPADFAAPELTEAFAAALAGAVTAPLPAPAAGRVAAWQREFAARGKRSGFTIREILAEALTWTVLRGPRGAGFPAPEPTVPPWFRPDEPA